MIIITYIKLYILSLIQDHFIFRPHPSNIEPIKAPSEYGLLETEDKTFITDDGVEIHYWIQKPADSAKPYIVFFQGNSGNFGALVSAIGEKNEVGYRIHLLKDFIYRGYGIIAMSHRGYGNSGGKPSEEGFKKDIQSLAKIIKDNDYKVISSGESLGAFSALYLMTQLENTSNLQGVALIAPFSTLEEKTFEAYPEFRKVDASKYLKYKFDNLGMITKTAFKGKILLIHGDSDPVSGHYHSEILYSAGKRENLDIELVILKDTGHTTWNPDVVSQLIFDKINAD